MCKLVPVVVNAFDFELENSQKEWSTENYWFVKPTDFNVRVSVRKEGLGIEA